MFLRKASYPLTWLLVCSLMACAASQAHGEAPSKANAERRVLLIAIDGLRPDALVTYAPRLRRFGEQNLHTYKSTVAIPISAPSWSTIFSGLSHKNTGVTNNAFTGPTLSKTDNKLASGKAKTVFNLLRARKLSYAVVSTGTWDGIEKIANYNNPPNPMNRWVKAKDGRPRSELAAQTEGIKTAKRLITRTSTRLVVYYTHHVDSSGHLFGHDPEVVQYAKAIRQTDRNLGNLLDAVAERERAHNEEWLVLITTDHGGSSRWKLEQSEEGRQALALMDHDKQVNAGIPQDHLEGVHGLRKDGSLDHEQTTTFILMKRGRNTGFVGAGHTNRDITPTIAAYLLPSEPNVLKRFDGRPLMPALLKR